jgi:putative serine protease PepD
MSISRCVRLFALIGALAAVLSSTPARGDWREASGKLAQATVSVEMASAEPSASEEADAPSDPQTAFASGTILSADGLIVTVDLAGAEQATFRVRLPGGETLSAKSLVVDHRSGLRLLKADIDDLKPLALAEDEVEVGQPIATLAVDSSRPVRYVRKSPPRVLSVGIVSATGRQMEGVLTPLIQTDIRAGMGSAGSPLVDQVGRLVGIVIGAEGADPAEGATFAIPASYIAELLDFRRGEATVVVHAAYLGVQLQTPEDREGAKIGQVFDDSPAAKAALKEGDLIVAVDGEEVADPEDLSSRIGRLAAGAEATLRLIRGDEEREIKVVLGRREAQRPVLLSRLQDIELIRPAELQYKIVPAPNMEQVNEDYTKTLQRLLTELMAKQQAQSAKPAAPAQAAPPASGTFRPYGAPPATPAPKVRIKPPATQLPDVRLETEWTPLTVRVQRPDGDRRIDELAKDVKALREDVQKLAEQLKSIAERLEQ